MTVDTYDNILQVAKTLFVKQGYTATSMREVAERAGIGKATIYHHFPDKQAILMTLVQSNIAQMVDALRIIAAEQDPRQRIILAANISIRFLYDSADLMQIARREAPGARDAMKQNFVAFFRQYMGLLEDAFRKGIEQGIFREMNVEDTAQVFMTMIQGNFAIVYITGTRAGSPEKAAARLLDVFFHGIDKEAG